MTERPRPSTASPPSAPGLRGLAESPIHDLRHAVRRLVRERGFTVTVLLTLALAVGAASAVFSVFDSVVLSPLPFEGSDRLVVLQNAYPGAGVERISNAVPDYFDRRGQVEAFEEVAVYRIESVTLSEGDRPERIDQGRATPSLFPLLRAEVAQGRLFTEADGEVGHERKVLLTDELWRRRFGAAPDVLGRVLRLDGEPFTVVGILPPGFGLPSQEAELWVPAAFTPEERSVDARHSNAWQMVARLAPGATLEQARAQIDALNERNLDLYPQFKQLLLDARFDTFVEPWRDALVRTIRPKLGLLLGGALFVLLIACVNVAELVLVRTTTRLRSSPPAPPWAPGAAGSSASSSWRAWSWPWPAAPWGSRRGPSGSRRSPPWGSTRSPGAPRSAWAPGPRWRPSGRRRSWASSSA